ncbi:hypothetical protein P7228_09075 [Altererythrobacter arenosus]|uniref:Uncharacterized protein n=1 Tax=Altererythrobacter arenosus TaxID=3032592 RepID=A0ABY8FMA3_9SPHN|nr:hypothetical protein [Altererythrobacter sp. CAU 1644]WFL76153.1 hypothetical protein P7228_09075 [Altererythrobacter sp. CAU 1644]
MKIQVFVAAFVLSSGAFAQSQPVEIKVGQLQAKAQANAEQKEAEAEAAADIETRYLPASTMVTVTPRAEISSKRVEEGHRVQFVVVDDVVQDGVVVIPRGTPVQANIPWKTGRAVGGKSGKFEVAFETIRLNGKSYAMSGQHRQEGRGNTVGALLGTLLISGRSAVMLPGQIVNAFTDEPIPYTVAQ